MLLKRVITAIALIALALGAIFLLPFSVFMVLTGLITLLAAWEWGALMGVKRKLFRAVYVALMALIMLLAWYVPIKPILWVTFIFWIVASNLVIPYPKLASLWSKTFWVRGCMGVLVLVPAWLAINAIRSAQNGAMVLLFLLLLIWSADIGAYFAGKSWGKHKLIPRVSPKKTWEGVVGGFLLALVVLMSCLLGIKIPVVNWLPMFVLTVMVVVFSVMGDLFESMLKRQVDLKDSGCFLPGHGGILDRIDSLTAASPVFLLLCSLLGVIH